jgi:hypothetical protein
LNAIALQIQLPAEPTLDAEGLEKITGKSQAAKQITWLKDHGWIFELDLDGHLVVGKLYAHLRLAGLNPAAMSTEPANAGGFDLSKTR